LRGLAVDFVIDFLPVFVVNYRVFTLIRTGVPAFAVNLFFFAVQQF